METNRQMLRRLQHQMQYVNVKQLQLDLFKYTQVQLNIVLITILLQ